MYLLVACTGRWIVSWDTAGRWAAVVPSGNSHHRRHWLSAAPPPRTFWPRWRLTFHCFWPPSPWWLGNKPATKETSRVRKTRPWPTKRKSRAVIHCILCQHFYKFSCGYNMILRCNFNRVTVRLIVQKTVNSSNKFWSSPVWIYRKYRLIYGFKEYNIDYYTIRIMFKMVTQLCRQRNLTCS